MVLRILGRQLPLRTCQAIPLGDWLPIFFSQAISWSPGCGVAVYADAGGHAAVVLIGDINLPQAHQIVTKTFTRWNWWTALV